MPRLECRTGCPDFARFFGGQDFQVGVNLADFFVECALIQLREHALVLVAAKE